KSLQSTFHPAISPLSSSVSALPRHTHGKLFSHPPPAPLSLPLAPPPAGYASVPPGIPASETHPKTPSAASLGTPSPPSTPAPPPPSPTLPHQSSPPPAPTCTA